MWDADELSKKAKKEIIQHRIRILENLAQDSITLAGMQIVALSLLINQLGDFIRYFDGIKSIEGLAMFLANSKTAVVSGLLIIVAMFTSVLCYYTARKKATDLPNALIYLEHTNRISPENKDELENAGTIIHSIRKAVVEYDQEVFDIRTGNFKGTINKFNSSTSSEHQLRGKLTFSAVLTFTSIMLFSLSLINSKFPLSDELFIIVLFLGIEIYFSFFILNQLLAAFERLRQIGRRRLDPLISKALEYIGGKSIQFVIIHPELLLYTYVVFLD